MIQEILYPGAKNAITGRELAIIFHTDIRFITAQIRRERMAGAPICAANDKGKLGYYLAEKPEDLKDYCYSLAHRERQINRVRMALVQTMNNEEAFPAMGKTGCLNNVHCKAGKNSKPIRKARNEKRTGRE